MIRHISYLAIIAITASVAGAAISFASTSYARYNAIFRSLTVADFSASYSRVGEIIAVDPASATVTARLFGVGKQPELTVRMRVTSGTSIERSDPILEGEELLGYTPAIPQTFESLTPGALALFKLQSEPDNTMSARTILLGSPFPQF